MNRDYYSIEDVILGLRREYKRHYEDLARLKKYVITADRRVKDYNFRLFQPCERKPNLYLDFEVKENELKRFLYLFFLRFGWDTKCYGKNTSRVLRDFSDEVTLSGFYEACISNSPEFLREVNAIMESDFVQNIDVSLQNPWVAIRHNYMYTGKSTTALWYYPQRDILSLTDLTFKGLSESLAVQVPRMNLSEYHQNHIDAYLESKKEVVIEDMSLMHKILDYKIEETDEALVLKRVP